MWLPGRQEIYGGFIATVIAFVMTVLMETRCVCAQYYTDDACDWTGSGLNKQGEERRIEPVYLRCTQGKITWMYPRGALRVVLRYGTQGKEFKGCIKPSKNFRGARIYLEGHRTLHTIYRPDDGKHPELLRCFSSYKGQVALYIEAEVSSNSLKKNVAEFKYDLVAKSRNSAYQDDPQEDCKPCTEQEMLHYYCVADFVAKGSISSVYNNYGADRTEISVAAERVYKDSSAIFHKTPVLSIGESSHYATMHYPLSCHASHGHGQFLFMGKIRLGNPHVWCAPRVEEWEAIRTRALKDGSHQCSLDDEEL